MLVFPQLATGAAALYPVTRMSLTRTVSNVLGDGSTVVFADPDAETKEWELRADEMTLTEWTAIDTLFQAVAGRFGTFTLLDPMGNLLLRSEEFGDPAWTNSPLIQLTPGVSDPLGTTRATQAVNAASVTGGIVQSLTVPGNFRYTLSVWAKTTGVSNVTLSAATSGGTATRNFALTSQWRRYSLDVDFGLNTESILFGVELDVGAIVDLFAMQVEAQPGASNYKRTWSSSGVYERARFAEDDLTGTAKGTDRIDSVIRIVAS
jgi:hypothetical protein